MALIWACSFDHYGAATGTRVSREWHIGNDTYLGDTWIDFPRADPPFGLSNVQGTYSFEVPEWGARAGDYALVSNAAMNHPTVDGYTKKGTESLRMAIPGSTDATRLIHFAFSISELPSVDRSAGYILDFLNGSGELRGSLAVTPAGRLQILDAAPLRFVGANVADTPNVLLVSSAPVISAQTWYFVSMSIDIKGDGAADVQVYLGDITPGNLVLDGSNLAFTDRGANRNIEILGFLPASFIGGNPLAPDPATRAIRDIVIIDESGTYNNALLGQCFVSAQEMRGEVPGGGWDWSPRQRIDDGVLDSFTNQTGLRTADAAALEIGSADFTFETWVRFNELPGSSAEANLFAKWRTDTNDRSYRLVYYGSDGTIRWEVSTDGIVTTTVKRLPWTPITDKWYHVAVVRSSGQTLLFINGVQLGVPVADANTYFNGAGVLGIAARYNGTSTLVTGASFKGFMDELRFTIGVARYTSDFTPSDDRFGRNVGDDPSYASVVLLLGFDGLSLADESSYGRTMSTTAPALTAIMPDDGLHKYNVLNNRPHIDDTYIEAAQTFATSFFTFEAIPTNGETMTVGSQTYTWVDSLSTAGADEVLIGASIDDCITNIIAAINNGVGEGTLYGAGTTANTDAGADLFETPQFVLQALLIGASGNSIATTETMADGYFTDTTLLGGQDIPADSDFAIERLPIDVTGVLGVQVTTRQYKTDAGSAAIQIDFVGPAGAVGAGTPHNPDLNPEWAHQIFEEDPDTSAGLTPSTMIGAKVRFKRTT